MKKNYIFKIVGELRYIPHIVRMDLLLGMFLWVTCTDTNLYPTTITFYETSPV